MVVMDCRRRIAAPPTVRVQDGEHRIRPHEQSDCMGAHTAKHACVPPASLRLIPSTSGARHVPS
eukprot:3020202-Prymnesium_polylepis.1